MKKENKKEDWTSEEEKENFYESLLQLSENEWQLYLKSSHTEEARMTYSRATLYEIHYYVPHVGGVTIMMTQEMIDKGWYEHESEIIRYLSEKGKNAKRTRIVDL